MFKNDFTKITENLEELDRKTDEKINTLDKIIKSNLTNIDKFVKFTNLIIHQWGFFEPHTTPQIKKI